MKDSMELSSFDFMLFPLGVGINGEILIIHNISRYCDGIYECVAFNDVPPAVNRVISVMVECEYRSLCPFFSILFAYFFTIYSEGLTPCKKNTFS